MTMLNPSRFMVNGPRRPLETAATVTDRRDRIMGCMLGSAVGDALGAPLEFRNIADIHATYGQGGLRDLIEWRGVLGAITDDTQMLLFAAEAALRARVMGREYRRCYPPTIIRNAFRRWYMTQGFTGTVPDHLETARGWLLDVRGLWAERHADKLTMRALRLDKLGTPEEAISESSGAGPMARCAPAAMFPEQDPFRLAREIAAITHGHPHGLVAAGYLAMILSQLMHGTTIQVAVSVAVTRGLDTVGTNEPRRLMDEAIARAGQLRYAGVDPSWADLEQLGNGRLAHDALALALFCALCHPEPTPESFEKAIVLATHHTGNSSTVGALTGQILGTMHGMRVIPRRWLDRLELRDVIITMAEDLATEYKPDPEWHRRYPPL